MSSGLGCLSPRDTVPLLHPATKSVPARALPWPLESIMILLLLNKGSSTLPVPSRAADEREPRVPLLLTLVPPGPGTGLPQAGEESVSVPGCFREPMPSEAEGRGAL